MIMEFVRAWDERKGELADWFRKTNQSELSYEKILKALITEVINPYCDCRWNAERIHRIDDGDYQGCELFVVPLDTYQPGPGEYFLTYQFYGSCSGCDLLEGIRRYDDMLPDEEQVKEYMMLALHLLQRCRYVEE